MSTVCVLPGTEYLHSTGGTVLGYFHSCIYSSILCVIYIRLVLGYFHSCIHSSTTPSTQAVSVLINASSLRDELYGHDETKIPNSNAARRFGHAMPTAISTRGQQREVFKPHHTHIYDYLGQIRPPLHAHVEDLVGYY